MDEARFERGGAQALSAAEAVAERSRRLMVRELARQGIADPAVLAAMGAVPRHRFVDPALRARAYAFQTLPIGFGQTISHPFTVARMTSLLGVSRGMRVLEVGTGSGYQTAVLACLGGRVYTVERLPGLYRRAAAVLSELGIDVDASPPAGAPAFPQPGPLAALRPGRVCMRLGDGTLGLAGGLCFDRIIVTAGGPQIPAPLAGQLDEKGIMLIPVGGRPREQRLKRCWKERGALRGQDLGPAVFVDLVGNHGWQP